MVSARQLLAGLAALSAATVAACGAMRQAAPEQSSEAGDPQPAIEEQESRTVPAAPTENYGPAPEITNEEWLNTDAPLRIADQRGKLVLVEFWTLGCINCQRVIPYVREWYQAYHGQGLEVISVHYPEFAFERDVNNVREALVRLDVPYPVAIDNARVTWAAYNQRYWPTLYLIDKRGDIRYVHVGEGAYQKTEQTIQALLAETL